MTAPASVQVDLSEFESVYGPTMESRLIGTIHINGVAHYVDAIAVEGRKRDQEPINDMNGEFYDRFVEATQLPAGDEFATVEYKGREYALFLYPYAR